MLDLDIDFNKNQAKLNDKIFFIASSVFLTGLGLYASVLNTYMSMFFFFCYSVPILVFLSNHEVLSSLLRSYLWSYILLLIVLFLICFSQVSQLKQAFINRNKV